MALCYQNRVFKGTNQHYGLDSSASISVYSTSVTVLGLQKKKKKLVQNGLSAILRLATKNTKYYLMLAQSALRDLWHEGCSQVADKAGGEAECFIIHETTTRVP